MLAMLIAARILDVSEFGYLALVYATLNQIVVLASAGLSAGATAFVAAAKDLAERNRIGVVSMTVSAVIAALSLLAVLVFSNVWANAIYSSDVRLLFALGAPIVLAAILTGTASGVLAGCSAFRALAILNASCGVILVVAVTLGTLSAGVEGGIIALSVGAVCLAIGSTFLVTRVLRSAVDRADISRRSFASPLGRLIRFAVPAIAGGAVVVPALFAANAFLVRESGAIQMAVLAVALQWQAMVLLPQTAVNPALLSHLANASSDSSGADYWNRFRSTLRLAVAASGVPAALLVVSAPIVLSVYGAEYSKNWEVLAVLAVSGLLSVVSNVVGNVIITSASMWWAALLNGLWAGTFLLLVYWFVPRYAALGVGFAHLGSYALHAVLCFGFLVAMNRYHWLRQQ
jgi:O-antigen/teichoic acid export membrane protein